LKRLANNHTADLNFVSIKNERANIYSGRKCQKRRARALLVTEAFLTWHFLGFGRPFERVGLILPKAYQLQPKFTPNYLRTDHAKIEVRLKELIWLSINQLCAETRLLEAWKTVHMEDTLHRKKKSEFMSTRSNNQNLFEISRITTISQMEALCKWLLEYGMLPKICQRSHNPFTGKECNKNFCEQLVTISHFTEKNSWIEKAL